MLSAIWKYEFLGHRFCSFVAWKIHETSDRVCTCYALGHFPGAIAWQRETVTRSIRFKNWKSLLISTQNIFSLYAVILIEDWIPVIYILCYIQSFRYIFKNNSYSLYFDAIEHRDRTHFFYNGYISYVIVNYI